MTDRQSLPILSCAPARAPGDPPGEWRRVTSADEVPSHGMKAFLVEGVGVLIAHTGDDEYVAVQAQCPHELVPLEQGLVQGTTLTCLEHMWQFDLRSGAPLGEAEEGLCRYPLKNEGGVLYVVI